MNQAKGLLRDTWWLWLLFLGMLFTLGIMFHFLVFAMFPALVIVFFYFAMMRYDDQGRPREQL